MFFLVSNPKYRLTDKGLTIKKVSLEDKGNFTCQALQLSKYANDVMDKVIKLNIQREYSISKLIRKNKNNMHKLARNAIDKGNRKRHSYIICVKRPRITHQHPLLLAKPESGTQALVAAILMSYLYVLYDCEGLYFCDVWG